MSYLGEKNVAAITGEEMQDDVEMMEGRESAGVGQRCG